VWQAGFQGREAAAGPAPYAGVVLTRYARVEAGPVSLDREDAESAADELGHGAGGGDGHTE
jgi:hypothetical protein